MSKSKHQKQQYLFLISSKCVMVSKFNIYTVHLKCFGSIRYPLNQFKTLTNKRPPGLIAPLLKFCNLLGNPPINTTKGRDLIFKWRHQAVKHGWQYLAWFTYIYPHLPLICPYLVIFTLNCPNLPIYAMFTLHIYSSSNTAPLCKMLKQSENESWRITHLAIGSHIWSLLAPIHMKSWPKVKLGKVQVGPNIARSHSYIAYMKSYLGIICPYSHEKLTKHEIRSSSNRFKRCAESLI